MFSAVCASHVIVAALMTAEAGSAASLMSVAPSRQRVGELITLRGSGFGVYTPGVSHVVFTAGDVSIESGMPYVWRDEFIQVRVPVGQRLDGVNTPIARTRLDVKVVGVAPESNTVPFQVITSSRMALPPYAERTSIVANRDVSTFLGNPNLNLARTKDAEFADVDGDGWVDLVDNNSNNVFNSTHGVLRLNAAGQGFTAIDLEPSGPGDAGNFAATIPPGGDYYGDGTTYDADFIDLNNDGLPDYVQTVALIGENRLRVLMNNHEGLPGQFLEQSMAWTGGRVLSACPDDIAHADINGDGWIDVAVCLRSFFGCGVPTSTVEIYLNQDGMAFAEPIVLSATAMESAHDVFLLDANGDGYTDVLMGTESADDTRLFLHDGQPSPGFVMSQTFRVSTPTGLAADLDGDGLDDFVVAGNGFTKVYFNDPDQPGTFSLLELPDAGGFYYDVELGDIDLNGAIDVISAAITITGDDAIDIWSNNGDRTFVHTTSAGASGLLPGVGNYQRLSADLLDYDRDGDLDLYLSGADGQDVGSGQGFGRVPNQFFANALTCPGDIDGGQEVGFGDLLAVLSSWGPCGACVADLNDDAAVTLADLLIVLSFWGACGG